MPNSQGFTPEEVEKGLLSDLLSYLLSYNAKSDRSYYDIHIGSDGYCTIVDWEEVRPEYENAKFEYVDEDHCVMKQVSLPDGSYEYVHDDEEEKELIEEFLKDHPYYEKTAFGRWVDSREYADLEKTKD